MKAIIFAALTLAMLAGQPIGALAQTEESASEQADKALAVALWQLSVATHTRIGFQSVEVVNTVGSISATFLTGERSL